MMATSRMFNTKTSLSVVGLLVGVVLLAILVSTLTVMLYGPPRQPTTVIVERPWWHNYRGWWGYHGAGLPGWGGPKYPPRPHPHPKPPSSAPSPPPSQPPANAPSQPATTPA